MSSNNQRRFNTLLEEYMKAIARESFLKRRTNPTSHNKQSLKNQQEHIAMIKARLRQVRERLEKNTTRKNKNKKGPNDPQPLSGGRRRQTRKTF